MQNKNIQVQIQESLFPEEQLKVRKAFVEHYLNSNDEERNEIVDTVISSAHMRDFSCLCYAMWLHENKSSVGVDVDDEYLQFIEDGSFKFFVLPSDTSLFLKISTALSDLENKFDDMLELEAKEFEKNVINQFAKNNPDLSTEELVEKMRLEENTDLVFSSEKWSENLGNIFELRNRVYWLYTHMMENSYSSNHPSEVLARMYRTSSLPLKDYLNKDVSDPHVFSLFRQKMMLSGEETVRFNKIVLPCSTAEAILYISRNATEQVELLRNFFVVEKGGSLKFFKIRRAISALPYLGEESLEFLGQFVKLLSGLNDVDRDFIEFTIDSAFIPEENMKLISNIFTDFLDDGEESTYGGGTGMESEYEELFKAVISELPEEVSEKFKKFSNNKLFLNMEFENPSLVTKENIREKIMAVAESMEDDSHENIEAFSQILYEWFSLDKIEEVIEKESSSSGMDFGPSVSPSGITQKMLQGSLKPKVVFTPEMAIRVEKLKEELPNFSEVIDFIITEVKLNLVYNGKMSFTPILLLGDPGLGKTYVAKELADILNTGFEFIDFGTASASWLLKGSSQQWKSASPGKVLEAMTRSDTINPVILYDEIDKGMGTGRSYPPEAVLYQLFEKNNSVLFEDEFLGMPFDASTIIHICTANTKNKIPQPLLSRLHIFEIQKLNAKQTIYLADKMYKKMIKDYVIFNETLPEDVLSMFSNLVPREIDRGLKSLLIQNTKNLSMEDLLKSRKQKLDLKRFEIQINKKPTLGF